MAIGLLLTASVFAFALGDAPSATARTGAKAAARCAKPAGEPILLSQVATPTGPSAQPFFVTAAKAAADSINCAGGVQGRPLRIIACNGNVFIDPNLGGNCAKDAIARGVVASVAQVTSDGAVVQAFNDAGIPLVGVPLNLPGLTAPLSFPTSAGLPGIQAGAAAALWDQGARHIRVLAVDSPAASAIVSFGNRGLKPRGGALMDPVLYPADPAADDSAIIQSAVNGADALVLAMTSPQIQKVVPELRAAGFKGKFATSVTLVDPDTVKQLGAEARKFVLVGSFYPATDVRRPAIARFNADITRFAPNTPRIEGSVMAWGAVNLLADALKQAPTIDAASIAKVLATYKSTLGIGPDLDFAQGGAYGIPRLFTNLVMVQHVTKNGKYVSDGDFFDPTQPPK